MFLRRLLKPFLPFRRSKASHAGRRRRWRGSRGRSCSGVHGSCRPCLEDDRHAPHSQQGDREVDGPVRRRLAPEASHYMMYSSSDEDAATASTASPPYAPFKATSSISLGDLHSMSPEEKAQLENKQKEAIRAILKASSGDELFGLMDHLIDGEWTAGKDALPGNIYYVLALSLGRHVSCDPDEKKGGPKNFLIAYARRFGFRFIMTLQLIGPPMVCYQYVTGDSFAEPDKEDWRFFAEFPSLHDWSSAEDWWTTKLLAFLFICCFCLNTFFRWMDEGDTWVKVFRIYERLNMNSEEGQMEGTSENLLRMGAFINSWVAVWLCIDMYLCLGASETAQDVLMDALGLAFLANLDDIGGDLGFVDEDDWPALALSWLNDKFEELDVAAEYDDIDDYDAEHSLCAYYIWFITIVLMVLTVVIPVAYFFTPFKKITHDAYYEGLQTEEQWQEFILNATAGVRLLSASAKPHLV